MALSYVTGFLLVLGITLPLLLSFAIYRKNKGAITRSVTGLAMIAALLALSIALISWGQYQDCQNPAALCAAAKEENATLGYESGIAIYLASVSLMSMLALKSLFNAGPSLHPSNDGNRTPST